MFNPFKAIRKEASHEVMRQKTVDIPKRPGSATTAVTYTLEYNADAWFKKYRVMAYWLDYTNLFEMSNGMEGEIGEFEVVMGVFKQSAEALQVYDRITERQDIYAGLRAREAANGNS